jgi:hypothetical protein
MASMLCQTASSVSNIQAHHASVDATDPAKPDENTPDIKMDAMAFGMGNCCLQITFQAYNVAEATRVYDALVPIAPIMVTFYVSEGSC